MNTGKWQGKKWEAIGVGIYENYACAWFGEFPDQNGEPTTCGREVKTEKSIPKEEPAAEEVHKPPVKAGTEHPNKPASPVTGKQPESQKPGKDVYYIIVRGQSGQKEMQRVVTDLKSKGFQDAKILENNNLRRVSIMEFRLKSKADSALRQVKKTWVDAWILKQ
jgi:hypothetical protein